MNKYIKKAKEIIKNNIYMTIATASKDGKPWVSPVFFVYDKSYNLYWVSNKEALHSKLLRGNPQASIVIFDSSATEGQGDGVYFETKVEELSNQKETNDAMELFNKRVTQDEFRIKKVGEVTKSGVWRIYKAIPFRISKLTEGEFINGQYVDKRVNIKLK